MLEVYARRHSDAAFVVRLEGELDLATAPRAEAEIATALTSDSRLIIVDLSALAFIDSAGLGGLIRAEARSRPDPGRLAFLRGGWAVQRVIRLCGADRRLNFLD